MVMVYLFDVLFVWFLFVKFWVCWGLFFGGGGGVVLVFPPFFVSFFVFVYIRGGVVSRKASFLFPSLFAKV